MILQSKYLPRQMTGNVINGTLQVFDTELNNANSICDYLRGLSIRTAQETELESIGRILGYPRPLVPEGFEQENVFLFTGFLETDLSIGFSAVESDVGGHFVSTGVSESNYMSIGLYRKLLDKIAFIKRYGITLYSIDSLAATVSSNYTITYDEHSDIVITYAESIGFKNLWVLTNLFTKLTTLPQVTIISEVG